MLDPYNYPSLNRKDCMYLQTIKPNPEYSTKLNPENTTRDNNLNTQDIKGAQSKYKILDLNKPNHQFDITDIKCSQSKKLIQFKPEFNKQSFVLYKEDIKGTSPNINKFYTKRQPQNPLMPVYNLQSYSPITVEVPKFIRDSLYIDDIDGTRKKKNHLKAFDVKLPQIIGAQPKKIFIPKDNRSSLNVQDINQNQQKTIFKSQRHIDPLQPIYLWKIDRDQKPEDYGQIERNQSKKLHQQIQRSYDPNTSQDILGAKASSLFKTIPKNNNYAYSNADIEGSATNTKQNGIKTQRNINPLDPKYQFLGRTECNNVFGGYQNNLQKTQLIQMFI
ncbi:hypothetical protein IMG5_181260 [Ichthyophthirius multifiliis]|uniref:Uncharacterized protein n=1 Tax=Ichthyophthirius multifiliis TaxID=5932 RepID=G0R2S5_ICHMU|nr:hypothetical protein IMG5_181260 [Ichthyophthirius multifiliis]EGR28197.1 hypothetical protein IMG5_181260 [Ichthyophthirius multifiliis]|eukprot:XP_004027542.1 hypothetical protein IMG5_181260 [Ichthyophthirius multifiliis]